MRVTILTRFPRVDVARWKLALSEGLRARGHELSILYTRSSLPDQLRAGVREFGPGIVARYRSARDTHRPADAGAAETLSAWAASHDVPVERFRSIRDDNVLAWLRAHSPDLVVLAGAEIVPRELIAHARQGFINPHYALLPKYRGMNVAEWSIFHDDPVAVSVHRVDAGIDTGDILERECVVVDRGDTLAVVRAKQQRLASSLLLKAVTAIDERTTNPTPQRREDGRQYYRMHPRLRAHVEDKLASGAYRWLARAPDESDETGRGTSSR